MDIFSRRVGHHPNSAHNTSLGPNSLCNALYPNNTLDNVTDTSLDKARHANPSLDIHRVVILDTNRVVRLNPLTSLRPLYPNTVDTPLDPDRLNNALDKTPRDATGLDKSPQDTQIQDKEDPLDNNMVDHGLNSNIMIRPKQSRGLDINRMEYNRPAVTKWVPVPVVRLHVDGSNTIKYKRAGGTSTIECG